MPFISLIPPQPTQILIKPIISITIFTQPGLHSQSNLPDIDELPNIVDTLYAINITVVDVNEAMVSLNIKKSADIDDISPIEFAV